MTPKHLFLFLILFFSSLVLVQGQGIRGLVTTEAGEPLAFASVYIRNLQDGVPTNESGRYEFKLAPGLYDVVVQYLGYASQIRTVEIKSD